MSDKEVRTSSPPNSSNTPPIELDVETLTKEHDKPLKPTFTLKPSYTVDVLNKSTPVRLAKTKSVLDTSLMPTTQTTSISLLPNESSTDEDDRPIAQSRQSPTKAVELDDVVSESKLENSSREHNNLLVTYKHMKNRAIMRKVGIVFSNTSRGFPYITFIILFMIFIVYTLVATLVLKRTKDCAMEYLVFLLIGTVCVFSCQYVSPLVHTLIFEFDIACYPFFVIPPKAVYYVVYLCSALGLFVVTILIFLCYDRVKNILIKLLGIKEVSEIVKHVTKLGQVQYIIQDGYSQMTLEGKFEDGLASGYCTWIDSAEQGEFLCGNWENGLPVGPFESTENNSRTMMKNVRVLFATDADGKMWSSRSQPSVGVSGVECIISGNYYSVYPKTNMIVTQTVCECGQICKCFKKIMQNGSYISNSKTSSKTSITISVDKNSKNLYVSGYRPLSDGKHVEVKIKRDQEMPYLELVNDWSLLSINSEMEGLVYIHSYGMSLTDALSKFGQLLALGNFPEHVVPICFNWPSGKHSFSKHKKAQEMTDNLFLQNDFVWLLQSLYQAKFRRIHILCHGIGGMFLLKCFSAIQVLFSAFNANDDNLMSFVNLILMNCDYPLNNFREKYNTVKMTVQRTTVYSDNRDKVLKISEKFTKEKTLGHYTEPLCDDDGKELERLELIDTGDLERNDDGSNHGFFNVNKMMVDDLFELVGQNKGAINRSSHLLKEKDNKYRFSLLPKSVTMV
ncbi:hypothetical protein EIN_267850 [Entamoeba invadens IP1]|uniref:Uncharacterized protein n=1 Tax=Entamoeba invadens IP1 TaxID=370355 RepID=A0A0A1U7Z1_ENTIV|nr:hypothetical protein EIN_267850 [Entamoeba invadens IP1]ELP91049.1 hypothetical protein EIN_267850 [Entamoeba invadens IP1]|eukprot:XP_004257820.1 hypothetical protein EIN_267850 [Entamoeba invadens IP1]